MVFSAELKLYVEVIKLWDRSCFLFGRDKEVVDIPIEHESCSKQHAVIQFRQITKQISFGSYETTIKPYLMDLESANGTCLNGQQIEACRYYELKAKDLVNFAESTRDYILLPYQE